MPHRGLDCRGRQKRECEIAAGIGAVRLAAYCNRQKN
jgi:hypothetical protein